MTELTEQQREDFLIHLSETGNVTLSAKAVGIKAFRLRQLRRSDEQFRIDWDEAYECGIESCVDAARQRAFQGVLRPVYQGGAEVGEIREFSDSLAKFCMEADRPEKFRRTKDINIKGLEVAIREMSDAELNAAIEQKLGRIGLDAESIRLSKL